MDKYIVRKAEIDAMAGLEKQHFLNPGARRVNKSLGDMTGLTGLGFHIIEVPPGAESTEYHVHHFEDECVYVLDGTATVRIGSVESNVGPGDFIGYRAGGLAHTMVNTGPQVLRCIVAGQRLDHDVGDYPDKGRRVYRNRGLPWDLVELSNVDHPAAGRKR